MFTTLASTAKTLANGRRVYITALNVNRVKDFDATGSRMLAGMRSSSNTGKSSLANWKDGIFARIMTSAIGSCYSSNTIRGPSLLSLSPYTARFTRIAEARTSAIRLPLRRMQADRWF